MRPNWMVLLGAFGLFVMTSMAGAQNRQSAIPASSVTHKSIKAIGYEVGGGSTKVIFKGTSAASGASGEARVEVKTGSAAVELKVKGMPQPTALGTEFLTYVLWAISPDGRTSNLGAVPVDKNGQGKLNATTPLQTFAMIVTAEPYFAVRIPSEIVVLENDTKKNTKGRVYPDNDYQLMMRGQYTKMGNPLALTPDLKNVPLEMYEARNAVEIAKGQRADKYAPEIYSKAESSLQMAENALSGKADRNQVVTTARQVVQFAEDARALASERQNSERIQREQDAAAAQAAAKAKAEADAKASEEAKRQAELTAAREAQMKAEAEAARLKAQAQAAKAKAEADAAAAQAKAEQDALRAKEEAAKAEAEKAQRDAAALRAQLLEQFNRVLETRDTPRGLVVNMADVLFDTGKYNLRPEAREKLAKLSGIVASHPGLHLAIEGHTDSTGSDELNMKLSQQRAEAVRDYLHEQGLSEDTLSALGLGKDMPVADNSTVAGRQKNRRVEIIVSGEVIGQKIGT